MKKLMILLLLVSSIGYSQNQSKIDSYKLGKSDVNVVVFPFGMENPIVIGTVSNSGDIKFDFPKELPKISIENKESESSKLWYTLFSQCDKGSEMVAENDNIFSFDSGALSLSTNDNPYTGVVHMVSNENLIPWIEDPGYIEPVLESYFELIYVAKSFQYNGSCVTGRMLDDGDVQITYNYDLNLKAGFNFLEYKIESIYKTDPNLLASFPDKVSVTSIEGIPNCQWIGKYF